MPDQVIEIPLDRITPRAGNRRVGGFDEEKLQQLADSIRVAGVLQPALVRPMSAAQAMVAGKGVAYELIAGERRYRASRLAGKDTLPCIVRDMDDITALRVQTVENLQREDVHPLDEADGYAALVAAGWDVERIAQEVGKSGSYVYQRLKLRELIPDVQKLMEQGKTTAGHAILIARLPVAAQEKCAKYLEEEGQAYTRYGRNSARGVSVQQLTAYIEQEIQLDLAKAPFSKKDSELVPKAGACIDCPRRTGFQPLLFADVSKDQCLDPVCYKRKLKAYVERRAEELGADVIRVQGEYSYGINEVLTRDPKAVSHWDVTPAKKGDPGARPMLITTGPKCGQVSYGKLKDRARSTQQSPAAKARQETEERKREAEAAKRHSLYMQLLQRVPSEVKGGKLPEDLLRILVAGLRGYANDDGNALAEDELERMMKPLSDSAIAKTAQQGLMAMLATLTVLCFVHAESYSWDRAVKVEPLAKARGIKPVVPAQAPPAAEASRKKGRKRTAA